MVGMGIEWWGWGGREGTEEEETEEEGMRREGKGGEEDGAECPAEVQGRGCLKIKTEISYSSNYTSWETNGLINNGKLSYRHTMLQ